MEKETARDLGQEVWLMFNNKAVCGIVSAIHYGKYLDSVSFDKVGETTTYKVTVNGKELFDCYSSKNLFLTKEDLIKSL